MSAVGVLALCAAILILGWRQRQLERDFEARVRRELGRANQESADRALEWLRSTVPVDRRPESWGEAARHRVKPSGIAFSPPPPSGPKTQAPGQVDD